MSLARYPSDDAAAVDGAAITGRGPWLRRYLLWVDGCAAGVAAVLLLVLGPWLQVWYGLPAALLQLIAMVSLGYAAYSLNLARLSRRPAWALVLLVVANALWALLCMRWALLYGPTASLLGVLHLLVEALFVGTLALLEWRWRAHLRAV